MGLLNEMKQYFIHENTDFIDDEEAVTDFSDLADQDIDNDGEVDDSDRYLHKRLGTIAKMDEEEELDEMSTTSATPGFESPYAFGKADDDTVEADGWKKIPKTNKIFKPMESKSTYKKMMAEMYGINEAVKYDIAAAVKTIQNFNKGTASDLPNETYLARQILRDLGYRVTTKNVNTVVDHLMASSDGEEIPEDAVMVKELIPMLSEAVSYRDYKKDPTSTPAQKVNKGIAEVNRMLSEMEKIVNNNLRLKQEAGVDSSHFWKTTGTRFAKINERMTRISNRLKELSK